MSNVIQLLERLGQDASLQNKANMEQYINGVYLDTSVKPALLKGDKEKLAELLGTNSNVACFVVTPNLENDEGIKSALINQDSDKLARLLDTKKDIVCLVAPAEDDEPNEDDEDEQANIIYKIANA